MPPTTLRRASNAALSLVRLGFEDEVYALGLAARNGHFLRLLAIGLVPRGNGVLACRQIGQTEAAILSGNCMMRILQHREGPVHPGMHIALHGDKFGLIVLIDDRRRAWRLRLVPLAIYFG